MQTQLLEIVVQMQHVNQRDGVHEMKTPVKEDEE
jgi:hypothetical protein